MNKENIDFIIVEPVDMPDMLERNYTVCKPIIARKATAFVDKVLESGDPLQLAENLTAIKQFIKGVEDDNRLNDYTVTELQKYEKGKRTLPSGTKLETVEAGTSYDFDVCNDPELPRLEQAAKEAAKAVTQRKEFLKRVQPEGMDTVDKQTGEFVKIYPPVKTSTTTVKVTLAAKEPELKDIDSDLPF